METTEQLKQAIMAWVAEKRLAGPIHWYTQQEWNARGETLGKSAVLSATIEESQLRPLLDFAWVCWTVDEQGERLYDEWEKLLESLGYMHELGFSWSMHFYPLDALLPLNMLVWKGGASE